MSKPNYYYVVQRLYQDNKRTFGVFKDMDGKVLCYTLEDIGRYEKLYGETRIWQGVYKLDYRNVGGMTKRYAERFSFHKGMLWLRNVPQFKYVYLHIGNTEEHTAGCILLGNAIGRKSLIYSTNAYRRVYKEIAMRMKEWDVHINVKDEHKNNQLNE